MDIPTRLQQHTDAKTRASMKYYASAKHTGRGHNLDTANGFEVYKSDSLPHRLTVETCLLSISHTIKGNKASTSNRDMNILAPMILENAPIKWNLLSEIKPPCLRIEKIPKKYRKFFTEELQSSLAEPRAPDILEVISENIIPTQVNHHYDLRPRV